MDLWIDEAGDLLFLPQEPAPRLKLSFSCAATRALRLSLFVAGGNRPAPPAGDLKLSFLAGDVSPHAASAKVVSGSQELLQRCKMALTTERGECAARPSFGSELVLWRKKSMLDQEALRQIQVAAEQALKEIVSDVSVIAKPERGEGNTAQRTVYLYIYSGQRLVASFPFV